MAVLFKTLGWLGLSGAIIFASNVASGQPWATALYGAALAKVGTTVAYFGYEVLWRRWFS